MIKQGFLQFVLHFVFKQTDKKKRISFKFSHCFVVLFYLFLAARTGHFFDKSAVLPTNKYS